MSLDATRDAIDVLEGIWWARFLDQPLKVNGREWRVPADFIPAERVWLTQRREPPASPPQDCADLAEAWGLSRDTRGQLEVARRICWWISRAERAIEKLGLELGVLEPQPPVSTYERSDWLGPARKHAPEPECPEPVVSGIGEGMAAETHVTVPGVTYAVRCSGASWYVVRIADRLGDTVASWHPSREAALAWAVAQAKGNWRPGGARTHETSWGFCFEPRHRRALRPAGRD